MKRSERCPTCSLERRQRLQTPEVKLYRCTCAAAIGSRWSVPQMATMKVGGGINEFVVEVIEHERQGTPGYDGLVATRIVKATHTRRRGQYGGTERGNRPGDVVWVKPTDLRPA